MAPSSWQPTAPWPNLALRARLLKEARKFFADREVTEVETPALVSAEVSDPQLKNVAVQIAGPPRRTAWLHTSPEYHMKRLLAAGAPDIFQICKVFRDGESGRYHEPEFTLIEWYRHGIDHLAMGRETADFVRALAAVNGRDPGAALETSYRYLFQSVVGLDPLTATAHALSERAEALLGAEMLRPLRSSLKGDVTSWQDLLMGHCIQPALAGEGLRIVHSYPAEQAALARLTPGEPGTAERFELFWGGVELANGYHELSDPAEQRQRFAADRARRLELGRPDALPDQRLLAALDAGLPDCAGVALGFDRLVMRLTDAGQIRDVISFAAPESGS